ncbi:MAG: UDP-N-acetylmuramoyl-L-alanyl-D-glutamate--2,6-diaminopimelate ligase [Clostridiales bacterium]|jgi:UDP-N-acetylmuramoyl-L-alanyl-D-glutamate--2,6-diaminopimelate ligase|nr:UDP-N-acetylmuramoyl-L-alanyl-D-glutamate--2,6-diaminopimelate ligase [Clostridiales bacterium]
MKIGDLIATDLQIDVSGISYDSRNTMPGDVFVAIQGFAADGHDFALAAREKGAVCVVCERELAGLDVPCIIVPDSRAALAVMSHRFFGHPSREFKLIGVTGTNGKTTVTCLIKQILEQKGKKVGLIGTNQNMIGEQVLPASHTTPESYELARLFREMADSGCEYVVAEVSSHALALRRVDGCEFYAAAFTNLTRDHLDFHKTMENYLNAKSILFQMCNYGIINIDDPAGRTIADTAGCEVITYGIGGGDVTAEHIVTSAEGVEFDCAGRHIWLGIPGKFSVYNCLAAIGVATALGVSGADFAHALLNAKGVKGRVELIPTRRDFSVIIDYAHTPDGLRNILETVREFTKGRLVVVFGCGGDRDKTKRPMMGKIAGELADYCVITSDNPRSEEPAAVIRDILAGMNAATAEYIVVENRRDAIEYAITRAAADDVIVLAGKGHETYQVLAGKTIHFDEREIVAEILEHI